MDEQINKGTGTPDKAIKSNARLIDAQEVPKTQITMSVAVFAGIITAIIGGAFFVLSEYFEIKSKLDQNEFRITNTEKDYSELKEIVNNNTFRVSPNAEYNLEQDFKNLSCPEATKQIEALTQFKNENCKGE